MKKPFLSAALTASAALALAACVVVMDPENPASHPPKGEFRKTVEFAAGGTVSLENDLGDVEITGWEKSSIEVVAQGTAEKPEDDRKVRAYGFWELKPDVEIQTKDGVLAIRTRPFSGPGDPPAVDYVIRVPNSVILDRVRIGEGSLYVSDVFGRIGASVEKGDLTVKNYSGSIDASVGTGTTDVEVLDVRDKDTVVLSSRAGDIILRLEPGAGARIEADAPVGGVRSELDLGVKTPAPGVSGRIGSGGASITLKAAGGRIEVLAVKDGPGAARKHKGREGTP